MTFRPVLVTCRRKCCPDNVLRCGCEVVRIIGAPRAYQHPLTKKCTDVAYPCPSPFCLGCGPNPTSRVDPHSTVAGASATHRQWSEPWKARDASAEQILPASGGDDSALLEARSAQVADGGPHGILQRARSCRNGTMARRTQSPCPTRVSTCRTRPLVVTSCSANEDRSSSITAASSAASSTTITAGRNVRPASACWMR